MARLYWGFAHAYGANARDESGNLIGQVKAFATKSARDEWVNAGNDYVDHPGARTGRKAWLKCHRIPCTRSAL